MVIFRQKSTHQALKPQNMNRLKRQKSVRFKESMSETHAETGLESLGSPRRTTTPKKFPQLTVFLSHTHKKREERDLFPAFYFLLNISTIIAPTTAIAATMMPIPGSKYWSDKEPGGDVGVAVGAGASATTNALVPCELP